MNLKYISYVVIPLLLVVYVVKTTNQNKSNFELQIPTSPINQDLIRMNRRRFEYNTNIRYRTQSAWDYYLKADFDDFVINDSQNTEFFRAIYNGGGTGKYAQFLNSLRAHNNSNVTVLGTLTENSSLRYKENIKTIEYGLDKVLQMRGVSYTKKDTGLKELGLIAEEVNEILPDVVLKNNEGEPDSVSYGRITAVLIEAIKDLQQQINVLNSK
jgi:hypothetical protein